jgi:hypothetical protein
MLVSCEEKMYIVAEAIDPPHIILPRNLRKGFQLTLFLIK